MQWNTTPNAGFTKGKPWLPVPASYKTYNVATESKNPDSVLNTYKHVIALRRSEPALLTGSYTAINSDDPNVLAYLRKENDDTVVVALNMSNTPQKLNLTAANLGTAKLKVLLSTTKLPDLSDTNQHHPATLRRPNRQSDEVAFRRAAEQDSSGGTSIPAHASNPKAGDSAFFSKFLLRYFVWVPHPRFLGWVLGLNLMLGLFLSRQLQNCHPDRSKPTAFAFQSRSCGIVGLRSGGTSLPLLSSSVFVLHLFPILSFKNHCRASRLSPSPSTNPLQTSPR